MNLPNKGYIKGNVVIMSRRANSIKQDSSFIEVKKLYEYMKKLPV